VNFFDSPWAHSKMIKSVLIVNNQGKPRLARFYVETPLHIQKKILKRVHAIVSKRSDDLCCCFAHDDNSGEENADATTTFSVTEGSKKEKYTIIYRHYATLYFVFLVDEAESELGILDLLQVFVQVLDTAFENVCELDLVYHFDRVNFILDELVMAGMVLETNLESILLAVQDARKLEQEENSVFGFEIPAALRT